jgi:hypothetical protein
VNRRNERTEPLAGRREILYTVMMSKRPPRRTKPKRDDQTWYVVDTIVDLLVHELPHGHENEAYIANLCVGFQKLTRDLLFEELQDMRDCWPFVFPATFSTGEVLGLIEEKYHLYAGA